MTALTGNQTTDCDIAIVGAGPYGLPAAAQVGECAGRQRGSAGMGWLRAVTDVPTALGDMLLGHLTPARYIESLRRMRVESVFSREDPWPSLAELALLPYQIMKKYL